MFVFVAPIVSLSILSHSWVHPQMDRRRDRRVRNHSAVDDSQYHGCSCCHSTTLAINGQLGPGALTTEETAIDAVVYHHHCSCSSAPFVNSVRPAALPVVSVANIEHTRLLCYE